MRRFWFQFGFPGLTLLVGCAIIYHFAVGHGRAAPVSIPDVDAAALAARWPPAPDTAALGALPLPRSVPLDLRTQKDESRIVAQYAGTLTLDGDGLHLRTGSGSSLAAHPDWTEPLPLDSVVFALAEPDPTGWRIARRAAAFVPPGGALQVPGQLTIPGVTPADLPNRWPVLVHWYRAPGWSGQVEDMALVLQGRRDVFVALLEERAR